MCTRLDRAVIRHLQSCGLGLPSPQCPVQVTAGSSPEGSHGQHLQTLEIQCIALVPRP